MRRIKWLPVVVLAIGCSRMLSAQEPVRYRLSIGEMFDLADRNSRSIRTFDLAEKEAGQGVAVAKNALLPSIDLSLSASYLGDAWLSDRNFSQGENAPMPHFGNNFVFEATQVVYAGGALRNAVAVAELQQQLARLDLEKNRHDIRFLLVGNYLELYKLYNQAAVYVKNIEQTRRLVADIRAKHQEGLALKNDITRYELQLQSLELQLVEVENGKTILNDRLVTTLGLPVETVIEPDTCLLDELPLVAPETQWQTEAGQAVPLLKQARVGVQQSEYEVKLAQAEWLPTVALFAGDRLDGPITIEVPPINKNLNYWYVGVGVKFNLASLYKTGKSVKRARWAVKKAAESERLVQEQVQTGVKAAYVRFVESFTVCDTQMKSLELATQNYDIIRKRYLNDLALITDMLDASNSKLNAELQVANARINILFHYYRLKKTAGNL